jgi:hypothetical protein
LLEQGKENIYTGKGGLLLVHYLAHEKGTVGYVKNDYLCFLNNLFHSWFTAAHKLPSPSTYVQISLVGARKVKNKAK